MPETIMETMFGQLHSTPGPYAAQEAWAYPEVARLHKTVATAYGGGLVADYQAEQPGPLEAFSYEASGLRALYGYNPANGTGTSSEVWQYDPGAFHQLVSYTDRTQNTTTYELFANGDVQYVEDPLGNRTHFTYTTTGDLPRGLVLTETSPEGRVTTYAYYDDHAADGARFGLVKSKTYTWPTSPNVAERSQSLVESFAYDDFGHLAEYADVNNGRTVYRHDRLGQLLEERTGGTRDAETGAIAGGILVGKYVYDSAGNRRAAGVPLPNLPTFLGFADDILPLVTTKFEYDALNRLKKIIEPAAAGQYFVLDADGNKIGPTTEYTYTADGLIETETRQVLTGDPAAPLAAAAVETVVTKHTYDARRQRIETTVSGRFKNLVTRAGDGLGAPNSAAEPTQDILIVTRYAYDAAGNLLGRTDALDRVTNFTYDADGRLVQTTAPDPDLTATGDGPLDRFITRTEYDAAGRVLREYSPNPVVAAGAPAEVYTRYYYDAAGRVIRVQQPRMQVYQGAGSNAGANYYLFTAYEYFADGGLKAERSGVSLASEPTDGDLNAAGGLAGDAVHKTMEYEYDFVGRTTKTTLTYADASDGPSISTTKYALHDGKLVVTETAPRQQTVVNASGLDDDAPYQKITRYNEFGQVASVQLPDPDGLGEGPAHALHAPLTIFQYYGDGGLASVTQTYVGGANDPKNFVTRYTYDELGRARTTTSPDGVVTQSYDSDGNVVETRRADGSKERALYNGLGLLIERRLHNAGDAARPQRDLSFYDPVGLLRYAIDHYASDAGHESGGRTNHIRDNLDRVTSQFTVYLEETGADAQNYLTIDTTYNAAGLVAVRSADQSSAFEYDEIGRTRETTETGQGTRVSETRIDDPSRQITVIDPKQNATLFTYDGLGRTIAEQLAWRASANDDFDMDPYTRTYEYDAGGNLTQTKNRKNQEIEYAYDALNRRISETWADADPGYSATLAYDEFGNLKSAINPNAAYVYDHESIGRLASMVYTTSALGDVVSEFQYDRFQRPEWTEITRSAGGQTQGLRFQTLFDSWGRLLELNDYSDALDGSTAGPNRPLSIITKYESRQQFHRNWERVYKIDGVEVAKASFTHSNTESLGEQTLKLDYTLFRTPQYPGAPSPRGYYEHTFLNEVGRVARRNVVYASQGFETTWEVLAQEFEYQAGQVSKVIENGQTIFSRNYDEAGNRDDARINRHNRISQVVVGGVAYEFFYDAEGNRRSERRFADSAAEQHDDTSERFQYYGDGWSDWEAVPAERAAGDSAHYTDDPNDNAQFAIMRPFGDNEQVTGEPRIYRVYASLPDLIAMLTQEHSFTTDAEYVLQYEHNGQWASQSVHVNQRAKGDYQRDGLLWTKLFELTLPQGVDLSTLTVGVRNNAASSGILVVDAIRLERQGGEVNYSYDYKNRLVEVETRNAPAGGPGERISLVRHTYDAFDRRIATETTLGQDAPTVEHYVYNGDNVALVFAGAQNASPTLAERRYYLGTDQLAAVYKADLDRTLLALTNTQGSVLALFGQRPDSEDYGVYETRLYDATGRLDYRSEVLIGTTRQTDVGFQGRETDWTTGLIDFRSRWQDPHIGSFVSEDGIGIADDLNRYRFERNSSPNYLDPSGHVPVMVVTAGIGALVGGIWGGIDAAMAGENVWAGIGKGALVGGAIGLGVGLLPGAVTTVAVGTMIAGATVGGIHGVADTYASNRDAGFSQYAAGFGLGAVSGAINPPAEFASAGGAVVGGGIEAAAGGEFFGTGFQAGGLVGGMGGSFATAYRAARKVGTRAAMHSVFYASAIETGGVLTGAGIGYATGGTLQSTLHGALLGNFGANIVNFGRGLRNAPAKLYDEHIALGLRDRGLAKTADRIGAKHFLEGDFRQSVIDAAKNPRTKISVVLDGLDGATPMQKVLLTSTK